MKRYDAFGVLSRMLESMGEAHKLTDDELRAIERVAGDAGSPWPSGDWVVVRRAPCGPVQYVVSAKGGAAVVYTDWLARRV